MFYNAAMAVDRDLNVAVAEAWSRISPAPRAGWEMLSATGVRGLRVLNETRLLHRLLLTERQPEAVAVLRANAVPFLDRGAVVLAADARQPAAGGPFDYVDLDPYGSPLPYLDAAFDALVPGGLLAVTATDMMVLAGVIPGACERRYAARPIRGRLGPEAGLRILLAELARRAAGTGGGIRPVLAYVHGHYVRAFVAVDRPARSPSPVASIDPARWPGPALPGTGPFGPMWLGGLFDREVVGRLEVPATAERPKELAVMVSAFREEVTADRPFYFEPNELAHRLHLPQPPPLRALAEELRAHGFAVGRTHARPGAFRTDAPRLDVDRAARTAASAERGPHSAPTPHG